MKTRGALQKIFTAAVIITSGIALTGCSKKAPATPTASHGDTTKKITLTVWEPFDDANAYSQIIAGYEQAHPNVTVNIVKQDIADYEIRSLNALAAGTGPDLWMIDSQWLPRHLTKIVPMPDNFTKTAKDARDNVAYYKDTWVSVTAQNNIVTNKVYSLPMYVDTLALYVNSQLWTDAKTAYRRANQNDPNFDDALFRTPPATWNDLLSELPYLTKKDSKNNITQGGISLGTSNNVSFSADMLSLLMIQNGTNMVDQSQKAARFNTFQNDSTGKPVYQGTNAVSFYTSFAQNDKTNYSWDTNQPDALSAFMSGKLAMMPGYEYLTQTLKQQAPTLEYDVYPMPQVQGTTKDKTVNYASYWTYTVTNNSRNSDTAWDFLLYASAHPNSYLSATKRPSALVPNQNSLTGTDIFEDQNVRAFTWSKGKYPEQVDAVMNSLIDNVTSKKQPAQAAIDAAASSVTDLLQKE